MEEHFFQCPYCWEEISMLIDYSVPQQSYVEDCEVCCNPIQISVSISSNTVDYFNAQSIEQ
ncbi:CPXCG motif-containing cysteine-rich protein [Gelidibacter salicanalis]|uniref:CPXCG motif-containing cysteine-rich protein n=1 Tax=Gelidibacter salicanalis TaxID=291193 RepID=A0A934KT80_9FLAO|nr:CPXCG motif-containing cysteine-rich protein [Gelidibacter salicanalis]MBJ7879040.1 CPXCG motif-containing cysteine-rich protein [Gelidibacter salicanalis]